jgi:hypothetical protein
MDEKRPERGTIAGNPYDAKNANPCMKVSSATNRPTQIERKDSERAHGDMRKPMTVIISSETRIFLGQEETRYSYILILSSWFQRQPRGPNREH